MQYFAHSLKACAPLALALLISACGEEDDLSVSQSESQDSQESQQLEADRSERSQDPREEAAIRRQNPEPEQSNLVVEVSPPSPSVGAQPELAPVSPRENTQPIENSQPVDQQPVDQQPVGDGQPTVALVADTGGSLNSSATQLRWNAQNVESCETSGAWQGDVPSSGTRSLTFESAGPQTYRISCQGPLGTAVAMVTILVESTSLAWEPPARNTDGSELTDLAGYNLYYGTEPGAYTEVRALPNPEVTEVELPVEPGTYYLAMTAYDETGNESDLSNEIVRIIN